MRIGAIDTAAGRRLVEVDGDRVRELEFDGDLASLLTAGLDAATLARGREHDGATVTLEAPVRPGKIVAIGLNYRQHATESGVQAPEAPLIFAKFPSSVVGPSAEIVVDRALTQSVDWEAELGVVVGVRMRNVPRERALEHVFGYTIANDVTARDRQAVPHPQGGWEYALGPGKNFDTSAPLGPWIVTRDDIPDPQDLQLRTYVNDEVRQSNSTAKMIWSVAEIVAFFSHFYTLQPGFLLETGTPGGTAWATDPEIGGKPFDRDDVVRKGYLQVGDVVRVEIEGIGSLSNPIVAAPPPPSA
jgi:2-keto-4-pentenoate hydratase/2-oxohepta-3-ene-1,7-dioic acid hydratase in catechol pathway